MPKQKISAKELISDIRAGMDDRALMKKYGLSAQGLQSAFRKLVQVKALKQSELDNRVPLAERTVDVVWKCPACGKPQVREFDECPECGVFASKFRKARADEISESAVFSEDSSDLLHLLKRHGGSVAVAAFVIVFLVALLIMYRVKVDSARKWETQQAQRAKVERETRQKEEREARERQARLGREVMERQRRSEKTAKDVDSELKRLQTEGQAFNRQYNQTVENRNRMERQYKAEEKRRLEAEERRRIAQQEAVEAAKARAREQARIANLIAEERMRKAQEAAAVGISCDNLAIQFREIQKLPFAVGRPRLVSLGIPYKRCEVSDTSDFCFKCVDSKGEVRSLTVHIWEKDQHMSLSDPGYCSCDGY